MILSGKVKKRGIAFATNEREERGFVVFDTRDVKGKVVMRVLETKLSQAA